MLNKTYNSHDYPSYISDLDRSHHVTRTRMNLVKKLLPLNDMEEGDYVYFHNLNGDKRGTWHMVQEKEGVFPEAVNSFISHAEDQVTVPKFATLPYFCYKQLDLSAKALYHVVKKSDMIDIISNGAKSILQQHYDGMSGIKFRRR